MVGIAKMLSWMPVDAHAKEGRDVDIVTHEVFRCFFNVSSGMSGWKKCVEEKTHAQKFHVIYKYNNRNNSSSENIQEPENSKPKMMGRKWMDECLSFKF